MSSDTLTFDETSPRRPTVDDCGGGAKVNVQPEPDPVRQLRAEDINQLSKLAAAFGRVMSVGRLSVRFVGGTPSLNQQSCARSTTALATFTPTDNGVGDTSITWPANTFPPAIAKPTAHVTGPTPAMIACEAIANGVRVRTQDFAGNPVDVPFDVDVF